MNEIYNNKEEPFGKEFLLLFISITIIYLFSKDDLQITIIPICILFSFLLIIIVSGKIEINFGNILKIKKDTEDIKKELTELKISVSNKQQNSQSVTVNTITGQPVQNIQSNVIDNIN